MTLNLVLTSQLESFVQNLIASGRFNNANEVVKAGLQLLASQEQEVQVTQELKEAINQGLNSGKPKPAAEVFSRLEAKYSAS